MFGRWPLMLKSTHEAVRRENYTLRDALREANKELQKHRALIGGLRSGAIDLAQTLTKKTEKAR
jgi:hypothetical protein